MGRKSSIDAFVAEARSYVGCPWRHRGRTRRGVDCIGVVVLALRAAGIEMRDRIDYSRTPWNDGLDREMREHFGPAIPLGTIEPGDVLTMRGVGQPEPGHVGVVAEFEGRLTLIHSYNTLANSVVVEHTIDAMWRGRFAAAYRPFP